MTQDDLDNLTRYLREDIERRLFLGDACTEPAQTAATPTPESSDPWKDLEAIWAVMKKPVAQAIWFIDEPGWYWRLRSELQEVKSPPEQRFIPSDGLPIHKWTVEGIAERVEALKAEGVSDEQIKRLYPFSLKGVWVQMSDGNHYQMVLTRNKLEAWLMNGTLSRIERS